METTKSYGSMFTKRFFLHLITKHYLCKKIFMKSLSLLIFILLAFCSCADDNSITCAEDDFSPTVTLPYGGSNINTSITVAE